MKQKGILRTISLIITLVLFCTFNTNIVYAQENEEYYKKSINQKCINLDWAKLSWDDLDWSKLDYGIYWYGMGNKPYKFIPNQVNPAFDPSKPTIIYVHGWQPDYSIIKHRESFYFYGKNSADEWIKNGWNVGVFYWNQFSDEINVEDAEAKIWTINSDKGMRWRKGDGTYDSSNVIRKNAAELFYDEYVKALNGYKGNEIRIAGHSLGSQMTIRLTKLISDNVDKGNISHELLPSRVALLDPYFSNLGKSYINNKWTGDVASDYIEKLIKDKNIPFEFYKSSALTGGITGDENFKLREMCAYTEIRPLFHIQAQQIEKHYDGKYNYFCSYEGKPPIEYVGLTPTGNVAASSKTPTLRIAEMMGGKYYWRQLSGRYTEASSDDTYQRISRFISTVSVSELELDKSNTNLKVGQYINIKANIKPTNATNKIVLWSSSDDSIAKVCVDGQVKGVGVGTANIKCITADGNIEKVCKVNVTK
ncbi:Ig-like domain (group 2) [Clostridium cavendishii DSM 21758]|uniref:Ig-like domain (Group 2) n=1 Tax=Clostridium cavendishii DSM 21758 TaxID=1121302 RepID=A0A1M6I1K9_9CLOT|nr:Ig-like domain-containing protein [Clostridium cavendishii]SHJ28327.1 Ig-like domain (group 2) [Clostridium cavendishii DSM 21758]